MKNGGERLRGRRGRNAYIMRRHIEIPVTGGGGGEKEITGEIENCKPGRNKIQ